MKEVIMPDWRSIETAPKGPIILLWYPWTGRFNGPQGFPYLAKWLYADDGLDRWIDPYDGRGVGRIRKTEDHVHNAEVFSWTITVPLPMAAWCHGSADSLDAAKGAFRTAWERFYSSLTPEQIARWHHTQDARKP